MAPKSKGDEGLAGGLSRAKALVLSYGLLTVSGGQNQRPTELLMFVIQPFCNLFASSAQSFLCLKSNMAFQRRALSREPPEAARGAQPQASTERARMAAQRPLMGIEAKDAHRLRCRGFRPKAAPCISDDRGRLAPLAGRGAGGSGMARWAGLTRRRRAYTMWHIHRRTMPCLP
jgi:hypothetical protein